MDVCNLERRRDGRSSVFIDTKSLHMSRVAQKVRAYSGFSSMKRLDIFLLHPGWDEHFAKIVILTVFQLKLRCCSILFENFANEPSAFILVDTD